MHFQKDIIYNRIFLHNLLIIKFSLFFFIFLFLDTHDIDYGFTFYFFSTWEFLLPNNIEERELMRPSKKKKIDLS